MTMVYEDMTSQDSPPTLSNEALVAETARLAGRERTATAELIAALAELEARRLYLGQGCSSMYTYCTRVLHLSEHAAYGRIEAARASRRYPVILEFLAAGSINLTTVCLVAPQLTSENHRRVLIEASGKSKREVERLVATLRPKPPIPSVIRKLPTPAPNGPNHTNPAPESGASAQATASEPAALLASAPPRPAVVAPLAPERYKVQFTVSRETYEKLRRAQDLLRHSVPDGDPAVVFERALTLLLAELESKKLAATERPRAARAAAPGSRHIPAAVRREVWKRDGGQCAFDGSAGRCTETGFLEFHHVVPFADGGETTVQNLQLRCRAHNAYEAEQWFGTMFVREHNSVRTECVSGPGQRVVNGGFQRTHAFSFKSLKRPFQAVARCDQIVHSGHDPLLLCERGKQNHEIAQRPERDCGLRSSCRAPSCLFVNPR
jgi:HNH endonuclease